MGVESLAGASRDVLRRVPGGSPVADLIDAVGAEAVAYGRRVLGVAELDSRLGLPAPADNDRPLPRGASLRDAGAALLDRSSAIYEPEDDDHPAYRQILSQLAPDEARILRLLGERGPQPIADVMRRSIVGRAGEPIAHNVSMVDRAAGVRHAGRMLAYWDNLTRLGLVEVADKPMPDTEAYSVLSAQPEIADEIAEAGGPARARMVRRRVELTPLGRDFTETVLSG